MLVYRQKDGGAPAENYELDGVSPLLKSLLAQRGIATRAQAEAFLSPSPAQLRDPRLMLNMDKACARIEAALEKSERICVYGDYDVDGVTSASMLSMYLKSRGGNVSVYIPSRHEEGYGLNIKALEALAAENELIISVDCGITSVQEAAYVKGLGRDIIVTDHHQLPPELPDCLCLDPLMGDYPFRRLCGAGVVFKLIQALGGMDALEPFWDLAALGTIADIVPLIDENRVIASFGLKQINANMRPGLRALCRVAGIKRDASGNFEVNAGNVAFQLAPRINAGGRMESAKRCVELLTCADAQTVEELAERLGEDNAQRQAEEQAMLLAAEKLLADADFTAFRAIIVCGEGWNPGVIGLAASRLTEKYHYPSIVLSRKGDICVGSCRSIKGVDIFAALSSCKDLFTRFGGHPQAAGLTLEYAKLPELRRRLDEYLRASVAPEAYLPELEYDCELKPEELNIETARELERLAPTGFGNPAPVFRLQAEVKSAAAVGQGGAHLKAVLGAGGAQIGAIGFRLGDAAPRVLGRRQDIVLGLGINTYMGVSRAQAEIKALESVSPADEINRMNAAAAQDYIYYLDRMLYNVDINTSTPRELAPEELGKRLKADAQGVIMNATDAPTLKRALIMISGLGVTQPPDVCRGYPADRRAFNALCLCAGGVPPKGYREYVSLGGWLDGSEVYRLKRAGVDVFRLKGAPSPADMKPGDGELRAMYKFIAASALRLAGISDMCALAGAVASGAGISAPQAVVALHIFRELGLVNFSSGALNFNVPPMHKVNLSDSAIYRRFAQ